MEVWERGCLGGPMLRYPFPLRDQSLDGTVKNKVYSEHGEGIVLWKRIDNQSTSVYTCL